jgi:uncharacterized protein (DUF2141 family)
MTMRFKMFGLAVVFAAGLAGTVAEAQQGNTITVPVTGLRNNTGEVRCGLFNSAATFPTNGQQFQGAVSPITNQQATCTFTNVPPGTYAVAIFHAERQGQTTMDTSAMGYPKDGYGFSRNAPLGTFGPPGFGAAAYAYAGGAVSFPITITYP